MVRIKKKTDQRVIQSPCWNLLVDDAVKLVDEMVHSDDRPGDDVFMSIIDGLCELNMLSEAKEFLNDKEVASVLPYNALLEAILNDGTFNMALLEAISMHFVDGCTLDGETYCILIQSMISLGHIEKLALYLDLMFSQGLSPNSETLSKLLEYLMENTQVHMIFSSIDMLVSELEVVDPAMYSMLINSLLIQKQGLFLTGFDVGKGLGS